MFWGLGRRESGPEKHGSPVGALQTLLSFAKWASRFVEVRVEAWGSKLRV